MSSLAPPWALFAEAIDGIDDTHLRKGIHVRALPSPHAGLPATPLFVYRSVLDGKLAEELARQDGITWIDSKGKVLAPPFDVKPDNPVMGYIPSPRCIWLQLYGKPDASDPESLLVEAMANSQDGPAAFAARAREPYTLGAQRMDMVRVRGRGQVLGARWLAREDVERRLKPSLWRIWSLPVDKTTPRYTPTPDALQEAKDRVFRGAPERQPMYVAYDAPDPGAAPAAIPDDAYARVDISIPTLSHWLDKVLNDMSVPAWDVRDVQSLVEHDGKVSIPVEGHLLAGAVEPDAGRWLGFGDFDEEHNIPKGDLVLYQVRGLWRWEPTRWDALQDQTLAGFLRPDRKAALAQFPELEIKGVAPELDVPYLDLSALAVAVVEVPPAVPAQPVFDGFDDRGWLSDPPPPDVRRIIRVRGSGFRPLALVALVANDDTGERLLNPIPGKGRLPPNKPPKTTPMPLLVMRAPDADAPGQGRFDDRAAPDGKVRYRMAQGDWFGRWGTWQEEIAYEVPRAVPLPPAVELFYAPPQVPPVSGPGPVPAGDLAGTLTIRVAVPRVPELPAGGRLLDALAVDVRVDGGAPVTTTYVLDSLVGAVLEPHPSPEHDMLVIEQAGPAIPRSGARRVAVVARWIDQGGQVSASSPPAGRQLVDPRPPPLPAIDTALKYSARPDVTGFARVTLSWPSTAGTRYRVFASTETTLLQALRNAGQDAIADQILAAAPGAPRAEAFRDNQQHFGWDAFECVTDTPLVATGATTRFVHRVSGSLDVLAFYRVLSEGESGVLGDMLEADIVPVAVPNHGPPARPLVSLEREPADHEHQGVRLRVKVPAGRAVPVAWRLRRASMPVTDPRHMGVVLEGTIPPGGAGAIGPELAADFTIEDPAPLAAWRHYRWVVEVQAGPPPGAPTLGPVPPGEWSEASAPALLAVIPVGPPAAPASVVATAAAGGVQLVITHAAADKLIGTALGSYRFEIHRSSPDRRPVALALSVTRGAGNSFEATDDLGDLGGGVPPAGSWWSVRVVDPTGRVSDAVVSNQI